MLLQLLGQRNMSKGISWYPHYIVDVPEQISDQKRSTRNEPNVFPEDPAPWTCLAIIARYILEILSENDM